MEKTILRKLQPVLQVSHVWRAVDFYVDCLGFEVLHMTGSNHPVPYAGVCRDGIEIDLELVDLELHDDAVLTPSHLRFLIDDPDAWHRELTERGKIDPVPPTRYGCWDTLDLSLVDPDGNRLTFYRLLIEDELK